MRLPHWLDLPNLPSVLSHASVPSVLSHASVPSVLTHGVGLVLLVVLGLLLYTAVSAVVASAVIGWAKRRGAAPLVDAVATPHRHRAIPACRESPENLRRAS